ncbi:MAG: tautomerase family protein [Synergistaceae bacterium]|jgi:4-oxalocrotonate tautomerase|nr:tautomerase family protein [Synergistaceae bacterium]MCE5183733.1 4-oxalocrotonate tautomerase family protein [Synergistaceae bacterium]MCK9558701.1 4-oxalocrotonate tautomerase family protein [Candidatus Cloacimonadota bacterium]PKL05329.1 MAG: 4-oxalocrotonate tautomerase [Synergistetes bacterium HGW-Synergistetes-1]
MPVIKVECAAMNVETKEKLIKSLTQTASSIMGIPEAAYIVLLNEMSKDNIGVGGEMLSKKQR